MSISEIAIEELPVEIDPKNWTTEELASLIKQMQIDESAIFTLATAVRVVTWLCLPNSILCRPLCRF
jgi:hypothetical protein